MWIDLIDQNHVIYVRADLLMNLEMFRISLVHPEDCHDVVFTNGFGERWGKLQPKQGLEHDGEVNDVSDQTSEDVRSIRNKK